MRTIMILISVFMLYVGMNVWHSVRPDLRFETKEVIPTEQAKSVAIYLAPAEDGFFGTTTAVVVPSKSTRTQYCVWYRKAYELPDFIWDELGKRGGLRCK